MDKPQNVVAAAVVETKAANPKLRTFLLLGAVVFLAGVVVLLDLVTAFAGRAMARTELEKQQQIAQQMQAVRKEQAELEKKTRDIQARIDAIQKLRASQKGPVAVLSAINERMPDVGDFRLESVEQKGGDLVIKGNSPNEGAVTQFGRSLEFSSGLFTNVNIETQRKLMEGAQVQVQPAVAEGASPETIKPVFKPETVSFTIKCNYTPPSAQPPAGGAKDAAGQVAQR